MDRLTRKSSSTDMVWFVDHDNNNMDLEPCEMSYRHNMLVIQKLAYYEDLEEQGRLKFVEPEENNRKYYRKCSICGKEYLQEDMYSSPNGLICVDCDAEMHPEEYDEND